MIFYFNEEYRNHQERLEAQVRAERMARLLTSLKTKYNYSDFTKEFYDEVREKYGIIITRIENETLIRTIEIPDDVYTMLLLICPEQ